MIEILVTCKDEDEAEKIASALLKKKLAACANYFPVSSAYLWKGRLEKGKESLMIIKTTSRNKEKAVFEIKKNHSYDVPAIAVHKVEATKEAEKWVRKETT